MNKPDHSAAGAGHDAEITPSALPSIEPARSYRLWDLIAVIFLLVMAALVAFGFSKIETNTEDVLQWLPDQSQARRDYDFFKQNFKSDDFVILTWPGCSIQDPRLRAFADYVRQHNQQQWVAEVKTGYDINLLRNDQLKISRAELLDRMSGVFFGVKDRDRTCALVELSHRGTAQRTESMQLIEAAIEAVEGLEQDQVSMAGYPYIATYIDQQLHGSYQTLLLPSVILATLISLLCLRDIRLGIIIFIAATGAAAVSIALPPACGVMLGGLMSIIPALVFVLATSGSIHLMRYSLEAIGDPNRLLAIGWKPCVISTATTAIGMLSLTRSEFPAIRNFGLFCAGGVVIALGFQLIIVPWLLVKLGQPGLKRLALQSEASTLWRQLAERIKQFCWPISIIFVLLIVAGGIGISLLEAEVEVEKLFRPDSEIIASLTEMEATLAPMDQTEVLLVFDDPAASRMHQRAAYTRKVQQAIQRVEQVGVAYSMVNFLPNEPRVRRARDLVKRSSYRDYLDRNRERLADGGMLAIDPSSGAEIWRVSIRFPFTEQIDFEQLRRDIESATETVAQSHRQSALDANAQSDEKGDAKTQQGALTPATTPDRTSLQLVAPPSVVYTGNTYLFYHAQLTLLEDLLLNFVLAFVIITPLLIVVLGSFSIGLIAMLPNIFPTVVVFGALGWLAHPVDLALAMTACVALGIAVDDTTHFLIRFRDYQGSLANVDGPIQQTLGQCGPAMLHTTMIASASLMTYYFSQMLVVSRFSWAISLLLAVALVADVFMLPAVLFLFGNQQDKSDQGSSDDC